MFFSRAERIFSPGYVLVFPWGGFFREYLWSPRVCLSGKTPFVPWKIGINGAALRFWPNTPSKPNPKDSPSPGWFSWFHSEPGRVEKGLCRPTIFSQVSNVCHSAHSRPLQTFCAKAPYEIPFSGEIPQTRIRTLLTIINLSYTHRATAHGVTLKNVNTFSKPVWYNCFQVDHQRLAEVFSF